MSAAADTLTALRGAAPEVHPALLLVWEIRAREQELGGPLPLDEQIALSPRIDAALTTLGATETVVEKIVRALHSGAPVPAAAVPEGF